MPLPFSTEIEHDAVALSKGGSLDHLTRCLSVSLRKRLPAVDVRRSQSELRFDWAGIAVTAKLDVDDGRVSAVYEYDGSTKLYVALMVALVFGAVAAVAGGTAGIGSAVGMGAVGFGIGMFWVGYGNLFIAYSNLTTQLKASLREAASAPAPTTNRSS